MASIKKREICHVTPLQGTSLGTHYFEDRKGKKPSFGQDSSLQPHEFLLTRFTLYCSASTAAQTIGMLENNEQEPGTEPRSSGPPSKYTSAAQLNGARDFLGKMISREVREK